jgi:diphosphomevalonate decarboxylase
VKVFTALAPSNIALIKYMGKIAGANALVDPFSKNRATNSSLSVTLNHLLTRVDISERADIRENFNASDQADGFSRGDIWQPLVEDGWQTLELSQKSADRFINHFKFLKEQWKIKGHFVLRSANNFPADCGLASSASSFAALTAATAKLAVDQNKNLDLSIEQISQMSRIGSGSSIRSFFGPYCIWEKDRAFRVDALELPLVHQVVVVEDSKKMVSSSEAHVRVATSPLFEGRIERAEGRLLELTTVLEKVGSAPKYWQQAFKICWDEFHDMHSLFSTSRPPFSYWTPETDVVVSWAEQYWKQNQDGPLVTMDAGANVHFLSRVDQVELRELIRREFSQFTVFSQDELAIENASTVGRP